VNFDASKSYRRIIHTVDLIVLSAWLRTVCLEKNGVIRAFLAMATRGSVWVNIDSSCGNAPYIFQSLVNPEVAE